MAERGISHALVETILQNPGQIVGAEDAKAAYQSQMNMEGRNVLVRLIVDDTVEPVTVVTVLKTTHISQYWR
jgi:hypothetical protein